MHGTVRQYCVLFFCCQKLHFIISHNTMLNRMRCRVLLYRRDCKLLIKAEETEKQSCVDLAVVSNSYIYMINWICFSGQMLSFFI